MADAVDSFREVLISAYRPDRREEVDAIIADAQREARLGQLVYAELGNRVAAARAAFISSYRARLGDVPAWLHEKLELLDRKTLTLAAVLVETCSDAADFASRWDVLEAACIEHRVAGARRVLAESLRQRYGLAIAYTYEDLLTLATTHELDACFHRLADASSLEDVIGPVVRRLESRGREG